METANLSKDKFISILAHDLRNPFNAIRGFSQMLVDHAKDIDKQGAQADANKELEVLKAALAPPPAPKGGNSQ